MKTIAIIGGGASGLFLACSLSAKHNVILFERGERLGRKLAATGNGQGNITNLAVREKGYFTSEQNELSKITEIVRAYDHESLKGFFAELGVSLFADERGRVYPTGRQASALLDALRFSLAEKNTNVKLCSMITSIEKKGEKFLLRLEKETYQADAVVICVGGKAAKNFGTDGNGYALAKSFGHTVSALNPSLVQLKTDTTSTKTLKGIRVSDGVLRCRLDEKEISVRGDILFTEYGISGDATFRLSAFLADRTGEGLCVYADFLPQLLEGEIRELVEKKRKAFPSLAKEEWLFGIVNNQIGRAILKLSKGDLEKAVKLVKNFPLTVKGSLGFDYAQVTKGGVLLSEVDENLQSKKANGLYFAGEILDVDGECGGFNLQWAYSSARTVATALDRE